MRRLTYIFAVSFICIFAMPTWADSISWLNPFSSSEPELSPSLEQQARVLSAKTHNIDPYVMKLALKAYQKAKAAGLVQKPVITIIDYSKPSTEPRLAVVDLQRNEVPFHLLVAHGKNSGYVVSNHFSNQPQSLASSLGVFVTGETYFGKHGLSIRLNGLERGVNDNAAARGVVIHGANYVSDYAARATGYVGRSWGCPAVSTSAIVPLIQEIKGGTLVFAYYPDKRWLSHSQFVGA